MWYNTVERLFKCSNINNINHIISEGIKMKKSYNIEVDCAACAQKMEEAANTVEGVVKATVSFMTLKMNVEFAEGADEKKVMKDVLKACKKVEDDCEIEF